MLFTILRSSVKFQKKLSRTTVKLGNNIPYQRKRRACIWRRRRIPCWGSHCRWSPWGHRRSGWSSWSVQDPETPLGRTPPKPPEGRAPLRARLPPSFAIKLRVIHCVSLLRLLYPLRLSAAPPDLVSRNPVRDQGQRPAPFTLRHEWTLLLLASW